MFTFINVNVDNVMIIILLILLRLYSGKNMYPDTITSNTAAPTIQ